MLKELTPIISLEEERVEVRLEMSTALIMTRSAEDTESASTTWCSEET
jgi:hypothetical protein